MKKLRLSIVTGWFGVQQTNLQPRLLASGVPHFQPTLRAPPRLKAPLALGGRLWYESLDTANF